GTSTGREHGGCVLELSVILFFVTMLSTRPLAAVASSLVRSTASQRKGPIRYSYILRTEW
ncbi:Hypothetical predicted protein, partial [Marmota monax]